MTDRYANPKQTLLAGMGSAPVKCRCSKCEARRTMTRVQFNNASQKCGCGSQKWRVDWFRQTRRENPKACYCPKHHFPHTHKKWERAVVWDGLTKRLNAEIDAF